MNYEKEPDLDALVESYGDALIFGTGIVKIQYIPYAKTVRKSVRKRVVTRAKKRAK